jgi:methyl-accepting chemotaxis protein
MKTGRSQRKLSNVKLTARFRMQYMGMWLVFSLTLLVMLNVLGFALYAHMQRSMGDAVESGSTSPVAALLIVDLFLLASLAALTVLTTHRVAGPYLGLRRAIDEIRAGDLDRRLTFRTYDHLDDLAAAFNGMMDKLQKQIGRPDPGPQQQDQPEIPVAEVR